MVEELKCNVQGRDVKNCPKTDCIHHPVNDGNGECGCVVGEWGMYVKAKYIKYTIQPTDSVAGVAKRFGVDLHELVKLNPQVCTSGPQAGIEIKIPVGHLEMVPDILPKIENDDPGVQEERVAGFKLKLPNGELYQLEKMVSVDVDLHEPVKLNPQVCTTGPQAGIEIKIPVDDGPAKQLFCGLLELYGSDAPSAFAMIYQIAEVSHNPEIGLEATIEAAAELLEARDITGAFDLLGITKNPSVMYLERADVDSEITYPPSSEHKRFAELKEIRRTYKAVVEWGTPKSAPIAGI